MGWFDRARFPYFNMQELNLDWLLSKVKQLAGFLPEDGAAGQVLTRTGEGAEWKDPAEGSGQGVSVVGQISSDCAHSLITDKQLAVLDDSGNVYGTSVNISDVMIKPRNSASGALAVFDNRGNVMPMSFDSSTPLVQLKAVAIFKNLFLEDATHSRRIFQFMQDFMVETGVLEFTTTNMAAAGNVYRQNMTVNWPFPSPFDSDAQPTVLLGSSDNMNATCWIAGLTCDHEKILRVSVMSHQANNISVKIPYIVIGKKAINV